MATRADEDRNLGLALVAGAALSALGAHKLKSAPLGWLAAGLAGAAAWKLGLWQLDELMARVKSAFGGKPEPTAEGIPLGDPPATPNPDAPFNPVALDVRWISPAPDENVDLSVFSIQYPIVLELRNLTEVSIRTPVDVELVESNGGDEVRSTLTGPTVTIAPKAGQRVTVTAQTAFRFAGSTFVRATAMVQGRARSTTSWTLD